MIGHDLSKLVNNLEAMLHESIVKIGYIKGQAVSIYYTEELLCHLLNVETGTVEQVMQIMEQFSNEYEIDWGRIHCSNQNGRYKLTVSAKGMEYVYERNRGNHFLSDLVKTLKSPNITIDSVLEVFYRYSPKVKYHRSTNHEFEYAIHFDDPTIDPFIYCFTFDEMGQYYHRFTEFDYMNLE